MTLICSINHAYIILLSQVRGKIILEFIMFSLGMELTKLRRVTVYFKIFNFNR
jgi:hypothetical protein